MKNSVNSDNIVKAVYSAVLPPSLMVFSYDRLQLFVPEGLVSIRSMIFCVIIIIYCVAWHTKVGLYHKEALYDPRAYTKQLNSSQPQNKVILKGDIWLKSLKSVNI